MNDRVCMPRSVAVLVLALLPFVSCGRGDPPAAVEALELEPGTIVEGNHDSYRQTLRSLRGEPVVVNFWATWCEPCKEEMPRFVEAAVRYDERVRFLGVNVEDAGGAAREFAREYRIPFPNIGDPRGEIRRSEQIVGLPTTHFYRADGELGFVHSGEIDAEELERKIDELIRIGIPRRTPAG